MIFFVSFFLCMASAAVITVLHFRMKLRLLSADLPVKWLMMPKDDWRMWKTYREEAPIRNWPRWPFYAYKILMVIFIVSGIVLIFHTDQLEHLLSNWTLR
jgi:hypothetical protein